MEIHLSIFYDILIYSRTWVHKLFLKQSKCSFAQPKIAYLGISAMLDWPQTNTIWGLHGFLGLTKYYRKFVLGYGIIVAPLTNMLRKNSF